MFNPDFYPTPEKIIQYMVADLGDMYNKIVFEPSAGSGAILKYVASLRAKTVACEKDPDLQVLTKQHCDRFLGSDFTEVSSEQVSHVDYIIMNPPFSADEKHILHAWNIAPGGCVIKALFNWETYNNSKDRHRKEFHQIVNLYGHAENLGDVFKDAERKTNVQIGLCTLYRPKTGEDEFDGYFDMFEDEELNRGAGLIQHNEITELVNRYVGAMKMFDMVDEAASQINGLTKPIGHFQIYFGATKPDGRGGRDSVSKGEYRAELQKACWKTVFDKLNMAKYVTKGVLERLNKFVEKHHNVPFKVSNVWKMVDMIVQTYEQNMNEAILNIYEDLTKRSDENRFYLKDGSIKKSETETWKTNSNYLIGQKFIIPMSTTGYFSDKNHVDIDYDRGQLVNDLTKALCFLLGKNWDNIGTFSQHVNTGKRETDPEYYTGLERKKEHQRVYDAKARGAYGWSHDYVDKFKELYSTAESYIEEKIQKDLEEMSVYHKYLHGTWYDWGFFEWRAYKKGTVHFKFKSEDVWAVLAQRISKLKGWQLPDNFGKSYGQKQNKKKKSNV